jgi:Xaa-Pro aminopeptidase
VRITEPFYRRKVRQVQQQLQARGLDGLFINNHAQIYYLFGFFYYPCERPLIGFIPREGEPALFVPRLEAEQVAECWVKDVEVYFEYPGTVHPISWICSRLAARGYGKARLGYEESMAAATLRQVQAELPQAEWVGAGDIVAGLRIVKDPEEITLIRKAGEFADFMLAEGVRYVLERGENATELEVNNHVNQAVVDKMIAELDEVIFVAGVSGGLVCSGPRSALAHGLPTKKHLQRGESLILSFACFVGGYMAESERVVLLGEPSAEQKRIYLVEQAAQEAGVNAVRPGIPCSEANRICLDVIRGAGLGEYIKHRMGHGVGIQNHEAPWMEDGDHTILRPGMAISCEPGIYVPGFGGYRISDTLLVTETGAERVTHFPRDLASATLRI